MTLGGDPNYLHDVALRLRADADSVDDCAGRTRRQYAIQWQGPASERFRDRVETLTRTMAGARDLTADAAQAVDELAAALAERQRLIAEATRRVEGMIEDAENTIGGLVGRALDSLGRGELAAYHAAQGLLGSVPALPAPGSPEWLDLADRMGA